MLFSAIKYEDADSEREPQYNGGRGGGADVPHVTIADCMRISASWLLIVYSVNMFYIILCGYLRSFIIFDPLYIYPESLLGWKAYKATDLLALKP